VTDTPRKMRVHLDKLLQEKGMTLKELSDKTGISTVNLGKLKNGRARGAFWSTLEPVLEVLECQPGDLLSYE